MRRCKREWKNGKIEEIEKKRATQRNMNTYYRKVSEQNRTYKGKTNMRNKQERMVEDTEQLKQVWTEYFEELLYGPEEKKM